jgi:hypothetical protein
VHVQRVGLPLSDGVANLAAYLPRSDCEGRSGPQAPLEAADWDFVQLIRRRTGIGLTRKDQWLMAADAQSLREATHCCLHAPDRRPVIVAEEREAHVVKKES